jgi:asparagine synthase (glutamine-hydrolysing)
MCGILGGWWKNSEDIYLKISNGLKMLKHRGPDGEGIEIFMLNNGTVGLGHRRLAIIDLSNDGKQPMNSKDGNLSLVFNGEIYNYIEIKKELIGLGYIFDTNTDTEVLLTAWSIWGTNLLRRIKGMYAFVVYDKKNDKLTCVRDAFGIKPLYYRHSNDSFIYSSEIDALVKISGDKCRLNDQVAYDYLVHGEYDNTINTFYENIFHLQPGHYITINTNNGEIIENSKWWVPNKTENKSLSFNDSVVNVREKFLLNLKINLRSDVAIGAALSGGIDSSAIVCGIKYIEPDFKINTYSYIANQSSVNEEYWINKINKFVNANSNKITIHVNQIETDLDEIIKVQGEPFGSTSIYAQYQVYKKAKETGITVMLDGQGADEMMAGYIGYPGARLKSLLEASEYNSALKFYNNWSNWPGRSKIMASKYLLSEYISGKLYDNLRILDNKPSIPNWIKPNELALYSIKPQKKKTRPYSQIKGRRVIDELAHSLSERGLVSLLRHADRSSMKFGIESRVPFLDIELAELCLSLPEESLISLQGETKHIFRIAMKGIVPDEILNRKDKIGFETPEKEWIEALATVLINNLKIDLKIQWLDQEKIIDEIYQIIRYKKNITWQMWRWLNFSKWYQKNFESSIYNS